MWLLFFVLLAAAFVSYRSADHHHHCAGSPRREGDGDHRRSPLAAEGERRADRLAQMFGDVKGAGRLDAIYVSNTKRAQQTAAPLASRLAIKPTVYSAADVDGTARKLLSRTPWRQGADRRSQQHGARAGRQAAA
ncbi:MAG: phosphoglycerate mutase family protein [Gammaproteobacteria bacterium]